MNDCLLKSLEQKIHKTHKMVMTTNMSTGKKFMKERIVNIANRKKKSRIKMAIAAVLMLVVVGCSFEKQNVDTSKQESLTSKTEETTEETKITEENLYELTEETTKEDSRVTENDEVADNIGESNNASEDEAAIDETKTYSTLQPCTYKVEDVRFLEYESFCNFKYNEKPDIENFRDFMHKNNLCHFV